MGKFGTIEGSPAKKARIGAGDVSQRCVPRASELNNLSLGGPSSSAPLGDHAIHAFVCKYADNGNVYSQWLASGPLYVINVHCEARPSPLLYMKKMIAGLAEMKAQESGEDEDEKSGGIPRTFDDLARELQSMYNFCGKQTVDDDGVGFVPNRSAFYVSNVKHFLMYFDELMYWRSSHVNEEEGLSQLEWSPKIIVHKGPGIDFDITAADEAKCVFETKNFDKVQDIVFAVPPPTYPSRLCIIYLELIKPTMVHIQIGGNTKPFQSQFVALKIKGQTFKANPGDQYGEYYRIIKHVEVETELKPQLRLLIGPQGLCGSPVVIRLHETQEDIALLRTNLDIVEEFPNVKLDL